MKQGLREGPEWARVEVLTGFHSVPLACAWSLSSHFLSLGQMVVVKGYALVDEMYLTHNL